MQITSSAFTELEFIPLQYTCQGEGTTPPLQFWDVPENTANLMLVVEDWDAPQRPYIHWLVFDLDPTNTELSEGEYIPDTQLAMTTGDVRGYEPPCPPDGTHTYHFRLLALKDSPDISVTDDFRSIMAKIRGSVITDAKLRGRVSAPE
jgi:Raf kinase inhibitor-like YbhB/YbcL family protein